MASSSSAAPPSSATALRLVVAVILMVAGAVLLFRPLTSLVVLLLLTAVALIAGAVVVTLRRGSPWRWTLSASMLALSVVLLVFFSEAASILPYAVAVLAAANVVRLAVLIVRRGVLWDRVGDLAAAAASALLVPLIWTWPDAATILLAWTCALAFLVVGALLLVRTLRGRRLRRRTVARHRALRGIGAVMGLLVVVAATVGSAQLLSGVASADGFYEWNDAVPAEPGKVLRVAAYEGEVPDGADAVRVLYATTYSDGSPALASAVIAYPAQRSEGEREVLAWQHGTTGVARTCGPSVGTQALTEYAIPGISRAIARDWVVVATDYPGQGTFGRYPYLIGEGEGRATLDGIRAAQQIEEAQASSTTWIWGHSQGGHATLWAGQLAGEYAPELEVRGIAALSAASDPLALAARITGAQTSALGDIVTSLVLVPYADEYTDVGLDVSVHPAGHGIVRAFASRCVAEAPLLVSALVGMTLDADEPLYRLDVTDGAVHERLSQNIADGVVSAPLFLGQGVEDEVIPIDMQRALDGDLCAAGRTVETHEYPGRSHMGVIAEGSPLIDDLYAWADAVAAGAEPSSCRR